MKYYSPATDLTALQRELGAAKRHTSDAFSDIPPEPDYSGYEDKYADQYDDDEDEGSRNVG